MILIMLRCFFLNERKKKRLMFNLFLFQKKKKKTMINRNGSGKREIFTYIMICGLSATTACLSIGTRLINKKI